MKGMEKKEADLERTDRSKILLKKQRSKRKKKNSFHGLWNVANSSYIF
jgi:hypothetical protein